MTSLTTYTPIPDGSPATPSLFNSRMSKLQQNIDALNSAKLETVITANITDGAVTAAKLASNAVTTSKILDDAVTGNKIADTSVITAAKMRATTNLNTGDVVASTVSVGSITVALVNSGAVIRAPAIGSAVGGGQFGLTVDSDTNLNVTRTVASATSSGYLLTENLRLSLYGVSGGELAPATGLATGKSGEVAYDDTYLYVCTSTNSWRRVALTAF